MFDFVAGVIRWNNRVIGYTLTLAQPLFQHAHDDVVGNEIALVHVTLRLEAERRLASHLLAQNVPGRDGRQPQPFLEQRGLRAFSCSRRSHENEIQPLSSCARADGRAS